MEGHRMRLLERYLASGLAAFADHEMLELLLCYALPRKDVKPLAYALLARFGTLEAVFSASEQDMIAIDGIGTRTGALLSIVGQLTRRLAVRRVSADPRPTLNTPARVGEYLLALLANLREEALYVLLLDKQMKLIKAEQLSRGTPDETHISPRQVASAALYSAATAVVVAHNHPGGGPPSAADIRMTKRFEDALSSLGVQFCGHYVVAQGNVYDVVPSGRPAHDASLARETQPVFDSDTLVRLIRQLDADGLSAVIEGISGGDDKLHER